LFILLLPANLFTIEWVLGGFVVTQLLRAIAYLGSEFRLGYFSKGVLPAGLEAPMLLSLLRQSLPLFGTALLTIPISQLPLLFLGQYSGMEQVGFYGLGSRLVLPLTLISASLMNAIYPVLSKSFVEDRSSFGVQVKHLFLGTALAGIILAWTLGLFSSEVIPLLFGEAYAAAAPVFSIQVWVALNAVVHTLMGTAFLASNNERRMVVLSVFNGIVIGAASYVGAHHGARELALLIWGSYALGFFVHWYFVRQMVNHDSLARMEIVIFVSYFGLSITCGMLMPLSLFARIVLYSVVTVSILLVSRAYIVKMVTEFRAFMGGKTIVQLMSQGS
jgi:O-antigen/teichoic acid export membrane protein